MHTLFGLRTGLHAKYAQDGDDAIDPRHLQGHPEHDPDADTAVYGAVGDTDVHSGNSDEQLLLPLGAKKADVLQPVLGLGVHDDLDNDAGWYEQIEVDWANVIEPMYDKYAVVLPYVLVPLYIFVSNFIILNTLIALSCEYFMEIQYVKIERLDQQLLRSK